MTYNELNQYIEKYIDADNTQSAIMLTGPWGCGKSYYIQNSLKHFLQEKGKKSVTVSIYGVKEISEISKNIYLDLQTPHEVKNLVKKISKHFNKSAVQHARIIGKAFIKSLINDKMSINLNSDSSVMQELYNTVDLSGKLIILEDVERSTINLEVLLGYVNGLVEDGIKILLVANEEEIIHYVDEPEMQQSSYSEDPTETWFIQGFSEEETTDATSGAENKRYTKDTVNYLRTKEKTIRDTIVFECDFREAIKGIMQSTSRPALKSFDIDGILDKIVDLFMSTHEKNLRTFIFAWTKTLEIYDRISSICTEADWQNILFGIMLFAPKIKTWDFPAWKSDSCLSLGLGNEKYPLYYFCYLYIKFQTFDIHDVLPTFKAHHEYKMCSKYASEKSESFNIIESWNLHSEKEVLNALSTIEMDLDDPSKIPFYLYGRLISALIACNSVLEYDYTKIKAKMVENVLENSSHIKPELLLEHIGINGTVEEMDKFRAFENELKEALEENTEKQKLFHYHPSEIKKLRDICQEHRYDFLARKAFLSLFDFERLMDMVIKCSAEELQEFREIINFVYARTASESFSYEDKEYLDKMLEKLKEYNANGMLGKDRIFLKQIGWLCDQLKKYMQ